jgi:hypothetical protein
MCTCGCGKVLAQPLCARLANMERGTDGTYRGNSLSCQVSREHHCGLLPKRINHGRTIMRARSGRRRRRRTNHHHQELIRSDERDCRPCGHHAADDAVAQAMGDVRSQRRDNAQPE